MDWESILNATESQKGWFPPFFKTDLSFENSIFNIEIINNPSSMRTFGKFNYSDNFINEIQLENHLYLNDFEISNYEKRLMKRIGFRNDNIKYYFTEDQIQYNRTWYYFIDINNNIIYFCNFIRM